MRRYRRDGAPISARDRDPANPRSIDRRPAACLRPGRLAEPGVEALSEAFLPDVRMLITRRAPPIQEFSAGRGRGKQFDDNGPVLIAPHEQARGAIPAVGLVAAARVAAAKIRGQDEARSPGGQTGSKCTDRGPDGAGQVEGSTRRRKIQSSVDRCRIRLVDIRRGGGREPQARRDDVRACAKYAPPCLNCQCRAVLVIRGNGARSLCSA
jgi:hypothetical protein